MHVALALAADCWGALDFIGGDGTVVERKLKISRSFMSAPPAGGAQKLCIVFEGDERKCFLAKGEIKKLANLLRKYETDLWVGAVSRMISGCRSDSNRNSSSSISLAKRPQMAKLTPSCSTVAPSSRQWPAVITLVIFMANILSTVLSCR